MLVKFPTMRRVLHTPGMNGGVWGSQGINSKSGHVDSSLPVIAVVPEPGKS